MTLGRPQRISLAVFGSLVGLCVVAGLAVIAYDAIVAAAHGTGDTISWAVLLVSREYPIVPAGLGLVVGGVVGFLLAHLWWPQASPRVYEEMDRLRARVAELEGR